MGRLDGMSLEDMEAALAKIRGRFPRARLIKNQVGNLAVVDETGYYVGFIDINSGEMEWAIEG